MTITEQHGYFVGENINLGSYQFQFTDAQGRAVSGVSLRHPITMLYHYQLAVMQRFGLDPGQLFLSWSLVAQAAQKVHQSPIAATVVMRDDPRTHTLSAQTMHLGPGPFTVSGDPANLSPPSPLVASVQGNAGQLSYSYPLDTPPGPAGFGPNLSLNYSSETVNERHAYNQPGGDFGDGWSLSPGAITADLHANNSDGGVGPWYNLSGVDGISDRLVQNPKDQTQFLTQHLTYLRIRMRDTLCFQVWDTSGTEYDFGCADATVQWHKDSTGKVTNYRWDLSKIIAPNEGNGTPQKTITFAYFQDCAPTFADPCLAGPNASNGEVIRDDALKQITVSAGSTVVSTTDFFYNGPETINDNGQTWVTPYNNNYYSACQVQKPTSTRCDDPISYPGGVPAPVVMATLSPVKMISYVGPDHGTGSSPAYEYDFTYTDTSFSSQNPVNPQYACYDPTTQGVQEYCAGEHLLSQVKPIVYQSGTAHTLKPVLFHYYPFTDTYSDHSSPDPMPGGTIYSISTVWQYMDYYYDSNLGTGAHVYYERGYSNTHGTPYDSSSSDDRYDPFYCYTHAGAPANLNCNTTSNNPFQFPDDRAWSTQLVTQITSLNSDSSPLSGATTNYASRLNPLDSTHICPTANNITTCVSDVWGPPTDYDWQDYYDGQYFGMKEVLTLSPANNLTTTYYFSTNGLGSGSAQEANYNSGSPYEEDIYADNTTSSPLLQQTTTVYTGLSNNNSCNGNYSGVYTPCEVIAVSRTTADCEGIAGCSTGASTVTWPQTTESYNYDDYTTGGGYNYSGTVYHNLQSEVITSNDAPTVTKTWTYKPDDQTIGSTVCCRVP